MLYLVSKVPTIHAAILGAPAPIWFLGVHAPVRDGHPDFAEAHANLGLVAFAREDFHDAEQELRTAVELNEDFAAECRKFYSAEVRTLPFSDPGTLASMNGWIKNSCCG